ncbi:hypothetical protein QJS10_CPB22g00481 [Acorus calamus]|uniref:U5 small nuclear ribonucleoprotein TSSC4 n=1 Tax=Acorus calamus TaxID=4465 RepID=A0AAV9BYT5_ACOCL|nr:hypothetical protein QJS10_CPB22g00481 [Acorus calamus]
MDDSFKARVDRLFGSKLFEAVPKSAFPVSSWSVSDGEVERNEWDRESKREGSDREETPLSSSFDGPCWRQRKKREFEDVDEIGSDDEGGGGAGGGGDGPVGEEEREEWEIRSSVGLDSTLDHEDEEDEFDKFAFCKEEVSDRVYMSDIKDQGAFLNFHNIISDPYNDGCDEVQHNKDPRADLSAAKARLKEDKDGPRSSGPHTINSQARAMENGMNLKSILKRKEGPMLESKTNKRVRFDKTSEDDQKQESEQAHDSFLVTESMEATPKEDARVVPDYIRNPSKYTHYTFDSVEEDDELSNLHAFDVFRNMLKGRLQRCRWMALKPAHATVPSTSIAVGEVEESEVNAMEEDDMETSMTEQHGSSRKPARQYRSKAGFESDDLAS